MDDLLITIIIAGIGLSIAYMRAELVSRRGRKVQERKKAIVQREWHANRLRLEQKRVPVRLRPPTEANLAGTLSGLVGSRLTLQNNSAGNPKTQEPRRLPC